MSSSNPLYTQVLAHTDDLGFHLYELEVERLKHSIPNSNLRPKPWSCYSLARRLSQYHTFATVSSVFSAIRDASSVWLPGELHEGENEGMESRDDRRWHLGGPQRLDCKGAL